MEKMRQWGVLTLAAVVAVLVAGWFLLVSPQRSHASQLHSQASAQRQSNQQLESQVRMLREQAKDLPKQQARLAQIATKIPQNPALPALVRSLSDAADKAGVQLVSLAPSTPQLMVPTAAPATGTTTKRAAAGPTLAQIGLTVQVTGTYFNIEQFFSQLEGLKRAMWVTGATFKGGDASSAGSTTVAPGTITASLNSFVFMSPTTQVAAAPVQPAAPAAAAK